MSGPKTPPDELQRRKRMILESDPPTPTMDEVEDELNGVKGHDLSLMNVSATSSRRESSSSEQTRLPDWITSRSTITNSVQRPNLRVINPSNGSSASTTASTSQVVPAPGSFLSQIQQTVVSQQSTSTGRNQSQEVIQQLLKNAMSIGLLNKSNANVASPDDDDPVSFDSAPFSPTDSLDMDSPQNARNSGKATGTDKTSLQAKVDKLLILAKASQGNSSATTSSSAVSSASLFKKPLTVKSNSSSPLDTGGFNSDKKTDKVSTIFKSITHYSNLIPLLSSVSE